MVKQLYRVYLLLGSNMGNREEILNRAVLELIDALLPDYTEVASLDEAVNTSSPYETEPWGFESKEKFINQAFTCVTELPPHRVLEECLRIEKELGRVRDGARFNDKGERVYSSRPIDIDILLAYEQRNLPPDGSGLETAASAGVKNGEGERVLSGSRRGNGRDRDRENGISRGGNGKNGRRGLDNAVWELCRIDDEDLVIPHPRMHEREFAKLPMREFVKGAPKGFAELVK